MLNINIDVLMVLIQPM